MLAFLSQSSHPSSEAAAEEAVGFPGPQLGTQSTKGDRIQGTSLPPHTFCTKRLTVAWEWHGGAKWGKSRRSDKGLDMGKELHSDKGSQ